MSRWEIYFSVWQGRSLKLPKIVYCLLKNLTLPEQKVPFPVVVFQLSMLLFCSLDLGWWNGNINLKFLLVYVQRGYLFCRDQQRIYLVLLVLQMLNINDKNLHENPFKVLEEDMARAARTINVIEEDEDDGIELDILLSNVTCY